ncbi:MAG: aldose 1-epimerase family protein [Janthinobacterium lividum]
MVEIFGRTLSRLDLARRTGSFAQFAGVRLVTLGDGVERGIRALEFRTGTGLRFTALVDRALDIADCEHKGRAVGWQSPSGFRHPGLHEADGESGLGFLRSFSGLLVTCGLDHVGFKAEEPSPNYHYGPRATVSHPIHGRIGSVPARLTGYGERWDGDRCTLWCEGLVQQSAVFGEDLHLLRRIEADVGTDEIRIHDRVVNHGFYETPHMVLYHLNVGYPVLDEGSRLLAPITDVVAASHAGEAYRRQGVGYRTMPAPLDGFSEQVWEHDLAADAAGRVPYAVVNDALGFGLAVEIVKAQLPTLTEWQHFQAGAYALGLEPGTNHLPGHAFARERGELIMLRHGEERRYDLTLRVLDGASAIAEAEQRIRLVGGQPEEDYPEPSARFAPLR